MRQFAVCKAVKQGQIPRFYEKMRAVLGFYAGGGFSQRELFLWNKEFFMA